MRDNDKILNRLIISRNDFQQSIKFLKELPNYDHGSIPCEALLFSAIICYARPFTCNEKAKNSKATAQIESRVLDQLTKEEHILHQKLLFLRKKAIAHAEWSQHPTARQAGGIIMSRPFAIWDHFLCGTGQIEDFLRLVQKVWQKSECLITNKIVEIKNKEK